MNNEKYGSLEVLRLVDTSYGKKLEDSNCDGACFRCPRKKDCLSSALDIEFMKRGIRNPGSSGYHSNSNDYGFSNPNRGSRGYSQTYGNSSNNPQSPALDYRSFLSPSNKSGDYSGKNNYASGMPKLTLRDYSRVDKKY